MVPDVTFSSEYWSCRLVESSVEDGKPETYLPTERLAGHIMSSLCGVGVRVRVNNFFSKTTRPRDMLFFYVITLRRGRTCLRTREQLLLQNYKA